ncbi:MAG: lycopene cyclase domain-containing protein [Chloroflexota bacterium]|nr:lycopene cyclase domain-containing protein [Chloroflexota bacterium]
MKYFGFLLRYVVPPLLTLMTLNWLDNKRGRQMPPEFRNIKPEAALAGHVGVAVAYTTPWDNYLVATKVWWYDPKLVTGLVLGWVPIEEYTFFVLQTMLTGSWMIWLTKHLPANAKKPANPLLIRAGLTLAFGILWLGAVWNLLRGPQSRRYLSLTLAWALLPIMVQTAFGGDILWQHRRLLALGIIPTTLYLGISDSLAISSGTWKINPEKTVKVDLIKDKLPLEEGLFFLVTNVLVSMGMTLVMATESIERVPPFVRRWLQPFRQTDEPSP